MKHLMLACSLLFLVSCNKDKLPKGVEYEVEFIGLWNSTDHPNDYPSNAHFSTAIGMTHKGGVTFWENGGMSTEGMKLMAETGNINGLEPEIQEIVDRRDALDLIVGERLSDGTTTEVFTIVVDDKYPLVSLVSMIAPSPDWFVGINGLSLKDINGDWVKELTIPLQNFDAGTDNGSAFKSSNEETSPQGVITLFTDPPLDYENAPLAQFKFTKK